MIYRDDIVEKREWLPYRYGGRDTLDALSFLQELNAQVYGQFPGAFTIAEESTSWAGVTAPVYLGGLGFGFKWNMGWMHDTLSYFSRDPVHRPGARTGRAPPSVWSYDPARLLLARSLLRMRLCSFGKAHVPALVVSCRLHDPICRHLPGGVSRWDLPDLLALVSGD